MRRWKRPTRATDFIPTISLQQSYASEHPKLASSKEQPTCSALQSCAPIPPLNDEEK
jgi:hypothetical protein